MSNIALFRAIIDNGTGLAPVLTPRYFARHQSRRALELGLVEPDPEDKHELRRTARGSTLVDLLHKEHALTQTRTRHGVAWHPGEATNADDAQGRRFQCSNGIEVLLADGWRRYGFEVREAGEVACLVELGSIGHTLAHQVRAPELCYVRHPKR